MSAETRLLLSMALGGLVGILFCVAITTLVAVVSMKLDARRLRKLAAEQEAKRKAGNPVEISPK